MRECKCENCTASITIIETEIMLVCAYCKSKFKNPYYRQNTTKFGNSVKIDGNLINSLVNTGNNTIIHGDIVGGDKTIYGKEIFGNKVPSHFSEEIRQRALEKAQIQIEKAKRKLERLHDNDYVKGDIVRHGNIENSYGIALGRDAHASVTIIQQDSTQNNK